MSKSQTNFPIIIGRMNCQRAQLEDYMRSSHTKLNQSFSGYFMKEVEVREQELKRKKVTKKKKVEEKREKMVELPRAEREEAGYQETSIKLTALPNKCYDSLFPHIRYTPALVAHEKQVYLIGGYHEVNQGMSLFHRYDYDNQKWSQVRSHNEAPPLGSSFHTV